MIKISDQHANHTVTILLPAKNEGAALMDLLPDLSKRYPRAEIIVVDDGSTDDTRAVSIEQGVRCISHPYSKGNGAAIKTGARAATGELLVLMDADGQHRPDQIKHLLAKMEEGFDLAVGARNVRSHAGIGRFLANFGYNRLASWMVGHKVSDLTSGFRAVRKNLFEEFIPLLPNGFSYPTTSTIAFFRAGHSVTFVPVRVDKRDTGTKSHIRPVRDGGRFLLIAFRIGTLYSPLKLFIPFSAIFFLLACLYYIYTFSTAGRFTNMGVLLFTTSAIIFLIGLLSEQITSLLYLGSNRQDQEK